MVLAGGRITGLFARAAGTRIKALLPLEGEPLLQRLLRTLAAVPGIGRICVVGPAEVGRSVAGASGEALWEPEAGSALANLCAGLVRLDRTGSEGVLIAASDLPMLEPQAVSDFLERIPAGADFALPVVRREDFTARYPGNLGIYVRLREGAFTAGGLYRVRPEAVLRGRPLFEGLFRRRKSQLAMAHLLGFRTAWDLVAGRLGIAELEALAGRLTGCRCLAVTGCRPELAFDLDSLLDLRYAERRMPGRARE